MSFDLKYWRDIAGDDFEIDLIVSKRELVFYGKKYRFKYDPTKCLKNKNMNSFMIEVTDRIKAKLK